MPIKGTNLIKRVGGYGGEAETIVNTRQQAEINSAVGPALIAALINRIRGRARQRGHLKGFLLYSQNLERKSNVSFIRWITLIMSASLLSLCISLSLSPSLYHLIRD